MKLSTFFQLIPYLLCFQDSLPPSAHISLKVTSKFLIAKHWSHFISTSFVLSVIFSISYHSPFFPLGSPSTALVAPISLPSPLSVRVCSLKLGYDILPLTVLWMKWFSMKWNLHKRYDKNLGQSNCLEKNIVTQWVWF